MIIVGVIVLIIILAVVGYGLTRNGTKSSQTPTTPDAQPTKVVTQEKLSPSVSPSGAMKVEAVKTFEVDGSNFKFSPNVLSVKEGDTVKITFKNTQGFHSFVLDEFKAKSKTIPADQTDELTFVASKKGIFEFYCGVGNHRAMGMVGKLTVQ